MPVTPERNSDNARFYEANWSFIHEALNNEDEDPLYVIFKVAETEDAIHMWRGRILLSEETDNDRWIHVRILEHRIDTPEARRIVDDISHEEYERRHEIEALSLTERRARLLSSIALEDDLLVVVGERMYVAPPEEPVILSIEELGPYPLLYNDSPED